MIDSIYANIRLAGAAMENVRRVMAPTFARLRTAWKSMMIAGAGASPGLGRGRIAFDLLWCWICALTTLGVFYTFGSTPDSDRFLSQAEAMVLGKGFLTYGRLETWLPPGYPVFLAALQIAGIESFVRPLQMLLHMLAITFMYLSASRYSQKGALIAGIALATSPLAAFLCGYVLSETLGMTLCSFVFFCYARQAERNFGVFAGLAGVALSSLVLTSPATIFLAAGVGVAILAGQLRKGAWVAACLLLVGAALPMVPWQQHCYRADGKLCYLVYSNRLGSQVSAAPVGSSLIYQWFRNWSLGERHMDTWFKRNPGSAPRWAFVYPESQSEFPHPEAVLDDRLSTRQTEVLAEEYNASSSFFRTFAMTILRSATLWFDMRQMKHAQIEYVIPFGLERVLNAPGAGPGAARLGKVVLSTLTYLVYIVLPVVFIWVCLTTKWRQLPIVPLVFFSILAYTVITAFTANNESRRNVVFYPAMLFIIVAGNGWRRFDFQLELRASMNVGATQLVQ